MTKDIFSTCTSCGIFSPYIYSVLIIISSLVKKKKDTLVKKDTSGNIQSEE